MEKQWDKFLELKIEVELLIIILAHLLCCEIAIGYRHEYRSMLIDETFD